MSGLRAVGQRVSRLVEDATPASGVLLQNGESEKVWWPRRVAMELVLRRGSRIFEDLDADGDGLLTAAQARIGLARWGGIFEADERALEALAREAQRVDKQRFLEIGAREARERRSLRRAVRVLARSVGSADWRKVFDSLDARPRDGYLTAAEISVALSRLGVESGEDVGALVAEYDETGDGRLSFVEFSRLACDALNRRLDLESARAKVATRRSRPVDAVTAELANREARRAVEAGETDLEVVERKIEACLEKKINDPRGVLEMQDLLYSRFKARYGPVDDALSARRLRLLKALREGDLGSIRALTDMSWDFAYPPARFDRETEGWCRTPLCLLVRPDEGNLAPFLPGVSTRARLELLEDVLASGCADPNFPRTYWSSPCVHACFEGDVDALALLFAYGANLTQRVEWLCQGEPGFTLAHAAAFNGNLDILRFLEGKVPRRLFAALDAERSNPLQTLLESSCDLETAFFLLDECGCDGFSRNTKTRSALSMAVERLPTLAAALLEKKSRFEYRWWGNDLFYFSYDGIVLPLEDGAAMAVRSLDGGDLVAIEDLVVRHDRKELLETPVMRDLLERKWRCFGSQVYSRRILALVAMLVAVFVAPNVDDPFLFAASLAALAASWTYFARVEATEIIRAASKEVSTLRAIKDHFSSLWNCLDAVNLLLAPAAVASSLLEDDALLASAAPLVGLLQITLALRALQYASMYRDFGPLLVTLLGMLGDFFRFSLIFAVVIGGFCNAFYTLVHFGGQGGGQIADDFSYASILQEMVLWLCGQVSFDKFTSLDGPRLAGAHLLFWSYLVSSYFILLNLLIAIFNSTYEGVVANSNSEWLLVRLQAMLEFEAPDFDGVDLYFRQLQDLSDSRSIGTTTSSS